MINAIEAIIKGLAMGLLLVISVGPVIFTVIKQSINNGKEQKQVKVLHYRGNSFAYFSNRSK